MQKKRIKRIVSTFGVEMVRPRNEKWACSECTCTPFKTSTRRPASKFTHSVLINGMNTGLLTRPQAKKKDTTENN